MSHDEARTWKAAKYDSMLLAYDALLLERDALKLANARLREVLRAAYDFYMGPHAYGDFTCGCNDATHCGICAIRHSTEAALVPTTPTTEKGEGR